MEFSSHWLGRACKFYTLTGHAWKMIAQTGLLDYSMLTQAFNCRGRPAEPGR